MEKKSFDDMKSLFLVSEETTTIKNNKKMFEKSIKVIAETKFEKLWKDESINFKGNLFMALAVIIGLTLRLIFNPDAQITIFTVLIAIIMCLPAIRSYFYHRKKEKINLNLPVINYVDSVITYLKQNIEFYKANLIFLPLVQTLLIYLFFYEDIIILNPMIQFGGIFLYLVLWIWFSWDGYKTHKKKIESQIIELSNSLEGVTEL